MELSYLGTTMWAREAAAAHSLAGLAATRKRQSQTALPRSSFRHENGVPVVFLEGAPCMIGYSLPNTGSCPTLQSYKGNRSMLFGCPVLTPRAHAPQIPTKMPS